MAVTEIKCFLIGQIPEGFQMGGANCLSTRTTAVLVGQTVFQHISVL